MIKLAKTGTELSNVKSNLTDTKIKLASKIEGTILNYILTNLKVKFQK
jgi:hypothetical protein